MSKFTVKKEDKAQAINRTIRMSPEIFVKIENLSKMTGVSFNKIVNQCLEFSLSNLDQTEEEEEEIAKRQGENTDIDDED